jgi:hypothetical protein
MNQPILSEHCLCLLGYMTMEHAVYNAGHEDGDHGTTCAK